MLDGTLQCAACGEPIPRTSKLQDDGTHICPRCGARVDALPRFLGAGQRKEGGERTDDPITMPAIPASAFEPAVPVAFTGRHRWKPRKGGPAFVDDAAGAPEEDDEEPDVQRGGPTPAYERVSHEIEAPAPPPVLRADSIPPVSDDDAPAPRLPAPAEPPVRPGRADPPPTVRPPRSQARQRGDDPPESAAFPARAKAPAAPPPRRAAVEEVPEPELEEIDEVESLEETPRPAPTAARREPVRPEPARPEPVRAEPRRSAEARTVPRAEPPAEPGKKAPEVRRAEPVTPRTGPSANTPSRAPARGAPAPSPPPMQASPPAARSTEAPPAPAPAAEDGSEPYTVTEGGGAMVVEWRWFGLGAILLGLVASCWTGLLTGWLAVAGYLASAGGAWLLLALLGGGVHLLLAVAVCYVAVAWFVNRTRVRASPTGLDVSVGPLPWTGSRAVPLASIARLVLTEHTSGSTKSYEVSAALVQGGQVTVIRGIRELAEAKRLEERVARNLGNPLLRVGAKASGGAGREGPSMVTPQSDAAARKKTGQAG